MKTTFIYALNDPVTGKMRYLGKSHNPYRRWQAHLVNAPKSQTHRDCWINSLLSQGLKPELEILDEVPLAEWQFWEREYIRIFKAINIPLTNHTPGGEGQPTGWRPTLETRARMSVAHTGFVPSAEARLKSGAARRGRIVSEKTRLKISVAKVGIIPSEEARQRMRAAQLGRKHSLATLQKMRASRVGQIFSQATRDKIRKSRLGTKASSETRLKMSAAGLRRATQEKKVKLQNGNITGPS